MGFLSKLFGTDGAYEQARRDLAAGKQLETNYYKGLAEMDQLNTSENQAALKAARDMLAKNTQRIAATAAVSGASPESIAIQKVANNESMENIAGNVAAQATANKRSAMDAYIEANRHYTQALSNARMAQAQEETKALGGLLSAGKDLAVAGLTGGVG